MAKIWIDKGYLIEARELEGPRGNTYTAILEFQVFDETGAPATTSYRGEGTVHPDGRIVLGDPHRDTRLIEGRIDRQATSESWNRYLGFKAALEDRTQESSSKPKKHYGQTADWWQGYQTGWAERRQQQKQRKITPNGGYYVWPLRSDGTPIATEGPYGPHDLEGAKTFARIAATEGKHDRAVSLGVDPKSESFQIVRRYKAGSGHRVI